MSSRTDLSRRRMLATGSAALAQGLGGVSRVAAQATLRRLLPHRKRSRASLCSWKDADSLIVHTPTTIETKRTALGVGPITPAERLYIRNNIAAPDVSIVANRDAWQLAVEGVRQPRTLTVAELKTLGPRNAAMVLHVRVMAADISRPSRPGRHGGWALQATCSGAACPCGRLSSRSVE